MTISRRSFARSILAAVAGVAVLRQAVAAPVKEQIAEAVPITRRNQWEWMDHFSGDSNRKSYLDFYDKFCRAMFEQVDAQWLALVESA